MIGTSPKGLWTRVYRHGGNAWVIVWFGAKSNLCSNADGEFWIRDNIDERRFMDMKLQEAREVVGVSDELLKEAEERIVRVELNTKEE